MAAFLDLFFETTRSLFTDQRRNANRQSNHIPMYNMYFPVRLGDIQILETDTRPNMDDDVTTFRLVMHRTTQGSAGIQARFLPEYDAHYPDVSAFAAWACQSMGEY